VGSSLLKQGLKPKRQAAKECHGVGTSLATEASDRKPISRNQENKSEVGLLEGKARNQKRWKKRNEKWGNKIPDFPHR